MIELAQEFAPFDLDLITSRAKALAQQQLASAATGTGAAPSKDRQEVQSTKPASSLQIKEQTQN